MEPMYMHNLYNMQCYGQHIKHLWESEVNTCIEINKSINLSFLIVILLMILAFKCPQ